LKTHGLTTMTCAIKNQFGCIPGIVKGEYHARYPDVFDFSRLLADITGFVRPRLYIADAIWAMEGNGPQSGDPKPLKCLLLSSDPVALDTVACRLMDCPVEFVPTIEAGVAAGLGVSDMLQIRLVGDPLDDFIDRAFKIKRMRPLRLPANAFLLGLRRHFTRQPVIDEKKCSRCGRCIQMCPVDPKAVQWRGDIKHDKRRDPPRYDYRRCIRCFCCHEMCPSRAIAIRYPLLYRLFPMVAYLGLVAGHFNNRLRKRRCR
jgi:Pyruvate/2-oxoacid:ferredoxin oxidoreductase delta subunit